MVGRQADVVVLSAADRTFHKSTAELEADITAFIAAHN